MQARLRSLSKRCKRPQLIGMSLASSSGRSRALEPLEIEVDQRAQRQQQLAQGLSQPAL